MPKTDLTRVLVASLLFAFCAGSVLAAPPAPIDIPESELTPTLSAGAQKAIAEWVDYWSKQLIEAKDEDAVITARKNLIDGYKYESAPFRLAYAGKVGASLAAVLDVKDSLKTIKIVNAGVTMARMPQISLQTTILDKMVIAPEAVARYYAWTIYRQIRPQLLGQALKVVQPVYAALGKQMATETSAAVLEAMTEFLNLTGAEFTSLDGDIKKLAVDDGFNILAKNWPTICKGIASGSVPMIDTGRAGIKALASFQKEIKDGKAQTQMFQMTADLMNSAGSAYVAARKAAKRTTSATQADNIDKYKRLGTLLQDCEKQVNAMVPDLKKALQTKITIAVTMTGDDDDVAAAVELAVLDVIDELVKTKGVVAPK